MGLPIINLSLVPVFPANVVGDGPVVVDKVGLNYFIRWDISVYSENPSPGANTGVLSYDPDSDETGLITLNNIATPSIDARLATTAEAIAGTPLKLLDAEKGKDSILANALTPTGSSATSSWLHEGSLYNLGVVDVRATTADKSTSIGTHTVARALRHYELVVDGSGAASGPERADFVISASAFKKNFPSLSADDGEIDTVQLAFRQVNGDAACILGNGVIINGFGAHQEATTYSIDPITFEYKHGVNMQDAVVNDRDGEFYGMVRNKTFGQGGTGVHVNSSAGAWFDKLFEFAEQGKSQFALRRSDATLILHAFNNPADFSLIDQFNGGMRLRDPDGEVYNDLRSRPVNYTPTIAVDVGTISGTFARCFYVRRGKQYEIFFDFTITALTGSNSSIRVGIPPGFVPIAGMFFSGCGGNHDNGKGTALQYNGGDYIDIREAAGGFPAVNGHRLSGSITLMTD